MKNVISDKVLGLQPSGIRKFFDIAAQMDNVISLSVGEPDFQTPWNVRQAAVTALEKGKTKYTANAVYLVLPFCVRLSAGTYIRTQAWIMTLRAR